MDRKKRVLFIGESTSLNTGFAVLLKEIMTRLYNTGKYELFEYASYISDGDPRTMEVPWPVYCAIPANWDKENLHRYNTDIFGQFGATLFEQVCLQVKPDICIDQRDFWMTSEWVEKSPFRRYFKYIIGPTIDGSPQRKEWVEGYKDADLVLTYSEYGKNILEKESGGKIKVFDIFAPGVNHEIYKPMNKTAIRQQFGLPENANIIMTVMRNQKRKLYPELMHMFKGYLQHCINRGNKDLATNSYLYLHTSYPDVGYDIARHILECGIGNRVLTTYCCQNCKRFYPDFFQTELTTCKYCGVLAAHMPNTAHGVSREELAVINNMADLYIQYSICEGFGMPVAEAKACCVPACGMDNTAVSEQVNAPGCFPIKNGATFFESVMETEQIRFLPDNDDAIKKIYKFFCLPKDTRQKMGEQARQHAVEHHSFDRSAKVWERAIDSVDVYDHNDTWLYPKPRFAPMNTNLPNNLRGNGELVDWCIINILGHHNKLGSYWRNELVKALNVGFMITKQGRDNMEPRKLLQIMVNIAENQNKWEAIRLNKLIPQKHKEVQWELV